MREYHSNCIDETRGIVVDLGSGGGLDVFLASRLIGPTGKAVGIDMEPSMVERARANVFNGDNQSHPDSNEEAQIDFQVKFYSMKYLPWGGSKHLREEPIRMQRGWNWRVIPVGRRRRCCNSDLLSTQLRRYAWTF